jgi:hypothetical protein
LTFPAKGHVYTVRGLPCPSAVWLQEIINPELPPYFGTAGEPCWNETYFRPLIERETDISIFKRLLEPTKRTERIRSAAGQI